MFDSFDFILEPNIILLGCQPWPPGGLPGRECPVCDHGVRSGDNRTYCAVCDSLSPSNEAKARSIRNGIKRSSEAEISERRVKSALPKKRLLSERARRLIWNGYRGGIAAEIPSVPTDKLTNLMKVGRDFLTGVGQVPDFNLILDKQGRIVGRKD